MKMQHFQFLGPVASALSNKYGVRKVCIGGSIIASFFFFISTFAPNLDVLIFTYGVMGGMENRHWHFYLHIMGLLMGASNQLGTVFSNNGEIFILGEDS